MSTNDTQATSLLRYWLQLSLTDGIGPILIRRLIDGAGGAEAACEARTSLLQKIDGIGTAKAGRIASALRAAAAKVDEELSRVAEMGASLISMDDDAYPVLLKNIPDPPPVLYVRGSFEPRDLHALAIVGSRKCSFYGREQAERFAALLAGVGMTVVSGGARGIDSSAHRGALSFPKGRTIAVLGSGIDVPYPSENVSLFDQIAERGAVVSEYALGTQPLKENFPRRNRIVSGLSRGVLVIEADERSGALITARQACDDHGRVVFALPGRVDNPLSTGPHKLIRDGAVIATCIPDILDNLPPVPQEAIERAPLSISGTGDSPVSEVHQPGQVAHATADRNEPLVSLSERQRLILAQLDSEPVHLDILIERTSLAAHEVMQDLTFMTLKGVVRRVDGQMFTRGKAAIA